MISKLIHLYFKCKNKIHLYFILFDKRISIGKSTIVYYKSQIVNISKAEGAVKIGKNCLIGRQQKGYHSGMPFYTTILNDGNNSSICIGNNCRINGAYIHAQENIQIGENCVIASGVNIIDSNGHETYSNNRTIGRDTPQKISIGNNVWIGINATILKGTSIGDNSIIAAGSIVKGEFPANSIISGNPAKVIKIFELKN